jgi:hypothetical protein
VRKMYESTILIKEGVSNMPNWCSNEVDVWGSEKDIKAFKELVTTDKEVFSFNKILPMPEELDGLPSPNRDNAEVERLTQKYGYADWYQWRLAHWGVKWDSEGELVDESDESLTYNLETPWCPPEGIYNELVERFPELDIVWFYREDGMRMAGWLGES